jgi:hypothetical protein
MPSVRDVAPEAFIAAYSSRQSSPPFPSALTYRMLTLFMHPYRLEALWYDYNSFNRLLRLSLLGCARGGGRDFERVEGGGQGADGQGAVRLCTSARRSTARVGG